MPNEPRFFVQLNRDSVCAGDDTDPHGMQVAMSESSTIADLLDFVARQHYLASISGGQATWLIAVGSDIGTIIGVVAQQWESPRLLLPERTPLKTLFGNTEPTVYFRYWLQVDPCLVFDCLRSGKDMPERRNPTPASAN